MTQRLMLTVLFLIGQAAFAAEPALVINSGGNTRYIQKVIFTKDGQQLVSVGNDRVIRVWDVKTGQTVRTIRDGVGVCGDCKISAMALTPDNKYLAVGGSFPGLGSVDRNAIYIYNFQTGDRVQLLKGHLTHVVSLVFSADGQQLASGSAYRDANNRAVDRYPVRLWKLGNQGWQPSHQLLEIHTEAVLSLAFSPDGQQLVTGSSDTTMFLWQLRGDLLPTLKRMGTHDDGISGISFSPDGRFIVSAGLDRQIKLWDAQGKFLDLVARTENDIVSLDVGPNKDRWLIVVGLGNGTAKVISLPDGKTVSTFGRDQDKVSAVSFSHADGKTIASTGGFSGEIWLWNADDGTIAAKGPLVGNGKTFWSVGFSNDGNSFAFGTERTSNEPNKYGRLQQEMILKSTNPQPGYRLSLGRKLESGAGYYTAIDSVTLKGSQDKYELRTRYGQTLKRKLGPNSFGDEPVPLNELLVFKNGLKVGFIRRDLATGRTHLCYTFTPDGRYIISGGEGGSLLLYETQNLRKPPLLFKGHTDSVWSVAVSQDGRFFVSGSSDQTIKLWDIKSESWLLSIFVGSDYEWIAWTPQGYYTSSLKGDKYIGWQVEQPGKAQPEFYRAEQFQKLFNRPDIVSAYLATFGDIQTAVEQTTSFREVGDDYRKVLSVYQAKDIAENLPPKIQILTPKDNLVVDRRLLNVKLLVTSSNLPITDVQVSLNGFQRGSFVGSGNDQEQSCKVELDMIVALKPDKNILTVVASHAAATSVPMIRTIIYSPPKPIVVSKPDPARPPDPTDESNDIRGPHWLEKAQYSPTSGADPGEVAGSENAHANAAAPSSTALPDPPTVEVLEPEESPTPIEINEENFILKVRVPAIVTARILKVRVLLNGQQRLKQDVQAGTIVPINIVLEQEGDYTLDVFAIADGVESAPLVRRIKYRNLTPPRPNLLFLGVGIKNYTNIKPGLQFADKDATDVKNLLAGLENSRLFERVVYSEVLINEKATRDAIMSKIRELNSKATHENDLRVVFFSGHGGTLGEGRKRYYFYVQNHDPDPTKDPSVLNPVWDLILDSLLDRGNGFGKGPVLLLVDTCRAGEAIPTNFENNPKLNRLLFFGASGSDQNANENPAWQNGAFTKALVEGLSGCADISRPDRPSDGKINSDELETWVKERVSELNSAQTASFFRSNGLSPVFIGITRTRADGSLEFKCREVTPQ